MILPTPLRHLRTYRDFIVHSIRRDVHARYLGTVLGGAWVILQPLTMIAIYTIVFSQVMAARLPGASGAFSYSVYLCAGLLPWMWFTETVQRCASAFRDNANLVKKAAFPRLALIAVQVGIAAFNFALILSLFLAFLAIAGNWPGMRLAWLVVPFAIQFLFSVGLGLLLATLQVFFRDTAHALGLALQLGFWLTPIVYTRALLPQWAQDVQLLNPMAGLAGAYQAIVAGLDPPGPAFWVAPLLAAAVSLALGALAYRRHHQDFADEL